MSPGQQGQSRDGILEEVRRIKDDLARSMDYDVTRTLDEARRRQREGDRTVIPPPARHKP
jgi:hypothetical protein